MAFTLLGRLLIVLLFHLKRGVFIVLFWQQITCSRNNLSTRIHQRKDIDSTCRYHSLRWWAKRRGGILLQSEELSTTTDILLQFNTSLYWPAAELHFTNTRMRTAHFETADICLSAFLSFLASSSVICPTPAPRLVTLLWRLVTCWLTAAHYEQATRTRWRWKRMLDQWTVHEKLFFGLVFACCLQASLPTV